MNRRILLSGVHGVGKGYFLEHKVNTESITVLSASDLIAKYQRPDDGYKRVDNVTLNQNVLFESVQKIISKQDDRIILDGHLIILSKDGGFERIPASFFEEGMFDTLFLLQDDPSNIYERLYRRDGFYKLDLSTIDRIQKEELKYARELEKQGVDVIYLSPDTNKDIISKYLT